MEMGKLTAKLRDAVPVCLLVEGKEIKRYKNIDIPDELKKLDYQDFKFDVPLNGAITFKIMFKPGVLPEAFPQTRERRTRKAELQGIKLQDAKQAAEEVQLQDDQPTMAPPPALAVEVFPQALEAAQTADEPISDSVVAMADEVTIKTEIIEGESEGQVTFITLEKETIEAIPEHVATVGAETQSEDNKPAMKPACQGKGKKNVRGSH